jgi:hypothetical protein
VTELRWQPVAATLELLAVETVDRIVTTAVTRRCRYEHAIFHRRNTRQILGVQARAVKGPVHPGIPTLRETVLARCSPQPTITSELNFVHVEVDVDRLREARTAIARPQNSTDVHVHEELARTRRE